MPIHEAMLPDVVHDRMRQLLETYLHRSTIELFSDHGIQISSDLGPHSNAAPEAVVGVTGFIGDLSGTLLLALSPSVAASCHPLREPDDVSERMRFDVVGELANQLTGRLKLRLSDHRIDLRLTAPVSVTGARMRVLGVSGRTWRGAFQHDRDSISVWVDADVRPSFRASSEFFTARETLAGREGEVIVL